MQRIENNFSGNQLRDIRDSFGLSIAALSRLSGVSSGSIIIFETEARGMGALSRLKIANVLQRFANDAPRQSAATATREVRRLTLADLPGDPKDYILADAARLVDEVAAISEAARGRLATALMAATLAANPTVGQDTRLWNATEALRILRRLFEEDLGLDLPPVTPAPESQNE